MKAYNANRGKYLAEDVAVADSILTRMKGLLGRDKLLPGEALWIKPCNAVHTFGMKFSIDVLFLDKKNIVVKTVENVPPNRLSAFARKASSTVELPVGTLCSTDTKAGDRIEFL